jgi:hypothetical protein
MEFPVIRGGPIQGLVVEEMKLFRAPGHLDLWVLPQVSVERRRTAFLKHRR